MGRLRLRTKFLIAMLLTSASLTAVSLLIVQHTVANHVRGALSSDLAGSVETFRNLQREREADLARLAELMADLPSLKALMTSHHAPTIQDGSREMFHLSGGDLFALLDPANQFVGFHTKSPGISREQAQRLLDSRSSLDEPLQWWFAGGHLYQVVLVPIYFGPRSDNAVLGVVAVGYEMNAAVARQVGQVAASQVAILSGDTVVVSTLNPEQSRELKSQLAATPAPAGPANWKLGKESYVVSALTLDPDESPQVTIIVMKSYDQATAFLNHLRHLLLAVGLGAVLGGSLLVYLIAGTFTRPLEKLVDGVRALGGGDFGYPLQAPAVSEVAEITEAFSRMRDGLRQAQQRLLDSERLATIGRMASSISHDLRHPLTAVLANAEFLADADLSPQQREELYLEIRVAVNRLTDLVDSLLELSRPAESLSVIETPVERTISRAIELVRAHRQFQGILVAIDSPGLHSAQFDPRKMERVFYNLLLNGCQAAQACGGHVGVTVADQNGDLRIQVTDDGPGVEFSIRDKLFDPFVSHGKENGTGLGLTIAQKIVQDHNGSLFLESSVPGRTVMEIILPRLCKQRTAVINGRLADASQTFTA
ncbi:MAG: HAMP domain-containing sensor histidine kinase [Candidatus Korobacteraceae bacterium]|jgi:signal transduction histidine kinase